MPIRIAMTDKDFAARFARLCPARARGQDAELQNLQTNVAQILQAVATEGEAAVQRYREKWDGGADKNWRVSAEELAAAERACEPATLAALDAASARLTSYHERTMPQGFAYKDELDTHLQERWQAIDAVGIYVPGGRASYPSSVLMNAIPARLAGVQRVVMATPDASPLVLAAAARCGVDEIYRMGGAHAIAALAFGAGALAPVDMVVGPGNAYVSEAKRQVFGAVGIDMVAGPSEVLIAADKDNDAALVAADLLSQAEHDPQARAMLLTDDGAFADAVAAEVARQLPELETKAGAAAAAATKSWEKNGALIVVDAFANAAELINRLAPEHVQLMGAAAEKLVDDIRHAGAIFLGTDTPEAIGDYIAGPTHVLPTAGAARYASGLSVASFMKRHHIVRCTRAGFAALAPQAARLADAERLSAHARSLRRRLNRTPQK